MGVGVAASPRSEGDAQLPVEAHRPWRHAYQLGQVHESVVGLVHRHLSVGLVGPVAELHTTETEGVHEVLRAHVLAATVVLTDAGVLALAEIHKLLLFGLVLPVGLEDLILHAVGVCLGLASRLELLKHQRHPHVVGVCGVDDGGILPPVLAVGHGHANHVVGRHLLLRAALLGKHLVGTVVHGLVVAVHVRLGLRLGVKLHVAHRRALSRQGVAEHDLVAEPALHLLYGVHVGILLLGSESLCRLLAVELLVLHARPCAPNHPEPARVAHLALGRRGVESRDGVLDVRVAALDPRKPHYCVNALFEAVRVDVGAVLVLRVVKVVRSARGVAPQNAEGDVQLVAHGVAEALHHLIGHPNGVRGEAVAEGDVVVAALVKLPDALKLRKLRLPLREHLGGQVAYDAVALRLVGLHEGLQEIQRLEGLLRPAFKVGLGVGVVSLPPHLLLRHLGLGLVHRRCQPCVEEEGVLLPQRAALHGLLQVGLLEGFRERQLDEALHSRLSDALGNLAPHVLPRTRNLLAHVVNLQAASLARCFRLLLWLCFGLVSLLRPLCPIGRISLIGLIIQPLAVLHHVIISLEAVASSPSHQGLGVNRARKRLVVVFQLLPEILLEVTLIGESVEVPEILVALVGFQPFRDALHVRVDVLHGHRLAHGNEAERLVKRGAFRKDALLSLLHEPPVKLLAGFFLRLFFLGFLVFYDLFSQCDFLLGVHQFSKAGIKILVMN